MIRGMSASWPHAHSPTDGKCVRMLADGMVDTQGPTSLAPSLISEQVFGRMVPSAGHHATAAPAG